MWWRGRKVWKGWLLEEWVRKKVGVTSFEGCSGMAQER